MEAGRQATFGEKLRPARGVALYTCSRPRNLRQPSSPLPSGRVEARDVLLFVGTAAPLMGRYGKIKFGYHAVELYVFFFLASMAAWQPCAGQFLTAPSPETCKPARFRQQCCSPLLLPRLSMERILKNKIGQVSCGLRRQMGHVQNAMEQINQVRRGGARC